IAVAAAAGSNVRLAVDAVVRHGRGPVVDALRSAIREVDGGVRLADALAAIPDRHGDPIRPLVAVLVDSERYGAPLGPALGTLSAELRACRRRRAEEHVRRVPVRVLLPLVTCVLPAFALLTVAPLLASGMRTLADEPPSLPTAPDQEGSP
ncbi:MAG TPA: type II secretion system F family protein, partial [Acidimicrobiales bacterium]